ncbi:hypothetical protein [Nonomuraea roseoviolacea]|uniref:Uncharacterized protein n=1 Tax=Nonomuraea roseoviolacea subsp. carminata TaxID=160689 RepID=A0ABT1KBB2_9ACTN|nr:hypothetical protein [Nonomuraea roseoviolacea]MCP2350676.1 hypothetical protein [Nonomuraea roseoviolacea subsp. carminata]
MTTYRLDPAGPHSDEYTRHAADAFTEAVHVLNHATRSPEGVTDPATIHAVLGDLADGIARLDQLLLQLTERLTRLAESGRVGHDSGDPAKAAHAVANATGAIDYARRVMAAPGGNLAAAHNVTASLYLDGGDL